MPNLTKKELKTRNMAILKYEFVHFFSIKQRIVIVIFAICSLIPLFVVILGLITQLVILESLLLILFLYVASLIFLLVRRIDNERVSFWEDYLINNPDNPLNFVKFGDDYRNKVNDIRQQLAVYYFALGTLCLYLFFLI